MARITGSVTIMADGTPLLNKTGAVASGIGISGSPSYEIEAVMGDGEFHGHKETPVIPALEVTITDRDDRKLNDLAVLGSDGVGVDVIFQARASTLGAGKTYTLAEAVCTRNFSITAGEGETPIKFIGKYWTEIGTSAAA